MRQTAAISLIVEGHGEVQAFPLLVRRILGERNIQAPINQPHRIPRDRMLRDVARAMTLQRGRVGDSGLILILFDSDDCDAHEAEVKTRQAAADDRPLMACAAVREYEAWFLAGLESLRGHRSVREDAEFAGDPELPRGAKERLSARMNEPYKETLHQPAFSQLVDLRMVRAQSRSFASLCDRLWEWAEGSATGT